MIIRVVAAILLLLSFTYISAQTPESIRYQSAPASGTRGCADQYAGTWRLGGLTGSSNDVAGQVKYLCFDDRLQFLGNGDYDLTGDPVSATAPGIAYAFYDCPPSVSGPDLATILGDPCITDDPPPANDLYVGRGLANGDILMHNTGNLQNLFNGGDPLQLWFAPITLDDFSGIEYEGNPAGPCVHANVNVAFSVVYLNAIRIENISSPSPTSLSGSFQVFGGLPEFQQIGAGRFYTSIEIEMRSNPNIKGTVTNGANHANGGTVEFTVPQPGSYRIIVRDGKACPGEVLVNMPQNEVEVIIGTASIPPNGTVCIPITVNNFRDIESFQFSVNWDPTIVLATGINIPSPSPLPQFTVASDMFLEPQNGRMRVVWSGLSPASLPDGTVLFEICFQAIGEPGDSTHVNTTNRPISIEFFANGFASGYRLQNGWIKIIDPADPTIFAKTCSTTGTTGTIRFTLYGGMGPYTYILESVGLPTRIERNGTVSGSGVLTTEGGLPPGTYVFTVTDANGTVTTLSVDIANEAPLFVSLSAQHPACFGDENGRIEISSKGGGAEPYTYKWSTGQFGDTVITRLPAGSYSVTVIDAHGCEATASTTLGVLRLTSTFNVVQPSCSGRNDGSIRAIPAGGTQGSSGYNFLWRDNGFTGDNRTNLSGDRWYVVTITDSKNCEYVDSVYLEPIKKLDAAATLTQPTCTGNSDGSITITATVSGGAAAEPYFFTWSAGTVVNNSPQSTTSGLAGNQTYVVTITDFNGCNVTRSYTLGEPMPLNVILYEKIDESCTGPGEDGGLTVIASGGTTPRTMLWSNGVTGHENLGLAAGVYTVTVTDANGCTTSASFEVEYTGPEITLDAVPATCPGSSDGSVNATITYAGSYSVQWNTGATTTRIDGLTAGWYYITVTGSDGCAKVDSAEVTQPVPITVVFNHTLPTCPGDSDGIIDLQVSGGAPPYSYSWLHSTENAPRLTGQRGGLYTVTITDQSGCPPLILPVELENPPFIMFSFTDIVGVSCSNSSCDGSATLNITGGAVTGGTFDVQWSTGFTETGVTSSSPGNLCFGFNSVTVTDGNGCVKIDSLPVPGPQPITLDLAASTIDSVSCNGRSDGSANLVGSGGTGPYTFNWPGLGQTGPSVSGLAAGSYIVELTDSRGCEFDTTIVIGQPEVLALAVDPAGTSDVGCSGLDDGQITVTATGGNAGQLSYTWTNGVTADGPVAGGLAPGTYSVTVTDSKGCTAQTSHTVNEPVPVTATIPTPEEPLCAGFQTSITVSAAAGGSGSDYYFSVDDGPLLTLGAGIPVFAGSHTVKVFDSKGCSFDTTIVIGEPAAILVDLGEDVQIDLGDTIALLPFIQSGLPIDSYDWTNGGSLSCDNCESPLASPQNTTTYTLEVTDTNGCVGTDAITVRVSKRRYVFIPDAFSPNSDGINDLFSVYSGKGVVSIKTMRIFNRWGDLLYETADLEPSAFGAGGWDGKFKGQLLDAGAYIYAIEILFRDNQTLLYKGDVTLIR